MDGLLTVNEAAIRLRKDPETIRRWIWRGRLRSQKIGGQHFITPEDLDAAAPDAGRLAVGEPPVTYAARPAAESVEQARAVRKAEEDPWDRPGYLEELWARLDAEEAASKAYRAAHPEEIPQTYEELMERINEMDAARAARREANKHKSQQQRDEEYAELFRREGVVPGDAVKEMNEVRDLRDAQILRAISGR